MIPISFSAWKDSECPFRFKVLRIDRSYKEPQSEAMRIGSETARILAGYRRHCIDAKLKNDLSYFDNNHDLIDEDIREPVLKMVKSFASTDFVNVPLNAQWIQIESQMAFDSELRFIGTRKEDWLSPKVAFRAVCDFAYFDPEAGELVIIDDKTGWGEPDDLQLRLYAYLMKTAWLQTHNSIGEGMHLKRIRCVFDNLATRTSSEHVFDPPETNNTRHEILERIEYVNGLTEWPATICASCKWCTVPGCEIRESAEKALLAEPNVPVIAIPSELTTEADAQGALAFLVFAGSIVDRVKDLLKVWVDEHGPVYAGGKVAQFAQRESWEPKDLAQLCKALIAYGAPPELVWNNLSLTKSGIEKVVKKAKLEKQWPFIHAMVDKKTTQAFGITNDRLK